MSNKNKERFLSGAKWIYENLDMVLNIAGLLCTLIFGTLAGINVLKTEVIPALVAGFLALIFFTLLTVSQLAKKIFHLAQSADAKLDQILGALSGKIKAGMVFTDQETAIRSVLKLTDKAVYILGRHCANALTNAASIIHDILENGGEVWIAHVNPDNAQLMEELTACYEGYSQASHVARLHHTMEIVKAQMSLLAQAGLDVSSRLHYQPLDLIPSIGFFGNQDFICVEIYMQIPLASNGRGQHLYFRMENRGKDKWIYDWFVSQLKTICQQENE